MDREEMKEHWQGTCMAERKPMQEVMTAHASGEGVEWLWARGEKRRNDWAFALGQQVEVESGPS